MEIFYDRGIVIKSEKNKIILDPESPKTPIGIPSIITHAHSDHTAGLSGASTSYCTKETKEIFEHVFKKLSRNTNVIDFHTPHMINGFEVELIPAGHLLGAAQIIIRKNGYTILYTGDFCPDELLCLKPASKPKESIDVLIMESTYGDASLSFESREQVRLKILTHSLQVVSLGKIPVFNVAHIGGSQEIIRLFNSLTTLEVYVHEKIANVCEIYNSNNKNKLSYNVFDKSKPSGFYKGKVVLLPRSHKELPENINDRNLVTWGIITGLSSKFPFKRFDFTASLSSHANFEELVSYINDIKPKQVITHYTNADLFAKHIQSKLKYPASALTTLKSESIHLKNLKKRRDTQDRGIDDFF